jgi:hypothetical protein
MISINDVPAELALAIREFWPENEWDHAASIAQLESGLNPFAEADTTHGGSIPCGTIIGQVDGVNISAEHSIGWFQLNACNFAGWEWARFFNTRHNAGTAHMLWAERAWQPWYFSAKSLGLL